jgi:membrane protein DedA with SNARE-associated domain/rhodanese-related sulfurtransferase
MNQLRQYLIDYGASIVFAAVLVEQLGLPLPALPWLMAAGALAAAGKFSLATALWVTVLACVLADSAWFYLGRTRGGSVLRLLCRISLEPDSCVRRTQSMVSKHGVRAILFSKFIPGLSTLTPPLAGMSGINTARFILVDAAGSLIYGGCFIWLGYLFSNQIEQVWNAISSIGSGALYLLLGAVAAYIGLKFWQRQKVLKELRMAHVTVEDLRRKLAAGHDLVIFDTRSIEEYHREAGIDGAIHLSLEDIRQKRYQIPENFEVVVYCSCPNDVSAARASILLRQNGVKEVRPLKGGIDAWKELLTASAESIAP